MQKSEDPETFDRSIDREQNNYPNFRILFIIMILFFHSFIHLNRFFCIFHFSFIHFVYHLYNVIH